MEIVNAPEAELALELGDRLVVSGTCYDIVGIDSYLLTNCLGQVKRWRSYTLTSDGLRHSLTSIDHRRVLWRPATPIGRDRLTGLRLNLELSGTAAVRVSGDPGPSTPLAMLLWFEGSVGEEIFAIERFLQLNGSQLRNATDHYFTGEVLGDD